MELLLGCLSTAVARKAASAAPSSWTRETTMTRIMLAVRTIALSLSCCLSVAGPCSGDDPQTINELRKEAAKGQSTQAPADETSRLKLNPIQGTDSTPSSCPHPAALDFFKHQIAYQRTEELDPFRGLNELQVDVWQRGPLTAVYVREKLNEFAPGVRMTYLLGKGGLQGGGTCPLEKNWRECVEGFAGLQYPTDVVGTCAISLDMSSIPLWKASPDDTTKRRIADELRREIEAKWRGVQQIVIRDFNPEDNQITMYLKMPEGDYYEGCGFHAASEPHCEGWHLFATSPVSTSARRWIFDRPYRLK